MPLPEILKKIYHNATDEVIRRGKKIFHTGGVQIIENHLLTEHVVFRVRNDIYYNHYKVVVEHYGNPKALQTRCNCPYNMGPICRHQAAALFQLNDLLQSGYFEGLKIDYDQKHTTVRMRQITRHFLKLFSSDNIFDQGAALVTSGAVTIEEGKNDTVKATVRTGGRSFPVILKQNEARFFDTSCVCDEKGFPLCVHKLAVFLQLLESYGTHYFSTIRDWKVQKNKLLGLYGYSLEDDLKGKFEFAFHEGKLFLRVLDSSIRKIDAASPSTVQSPKEDPASGRRMGVVVIPKGTYYPHTTFQLISGNPNDTMTGFSGKVEQMETGKYIATSGMADEDRVLVTALRKQSSDELIKFIKRDSPFGEFWDSLPKELKGTPNKELIMQAWDFYLPRYKNLLKQFEKFPFVYFLPEGKTLVAKNLVSLRFAPVPFSAQIEVAPVDKRKKNPAIRLHLRFKIGDHFINYDEAVLINPALLLVDQVLYAADSEAVIQSVALFQQQSVYTVSAGDWPAFLKATLLPLLSVIPVVFDEALIEDQPEVTPKLQLHLKETEKSFIFKPVFIYDDLQKGWLDFEPLRRAEDGRLIIQKRDEAAEQMFLTTLRHLHPAMQESRKLASFVLPAKEAFKGNWYFEFRSKLAEMQVEVRGYEQLRQLKISPHKPVTKLQVSSGIDWFDTVVAVSFGDEKVGIATIKKAMARKQNFVSLKDGSVGLLPQEWMDKYAMLVKLGTIKEGNTLRLKKFHFSALEDMKSEIKEEEILAHLSEKREKLLTFDFDQQLAVALPDNINAQLRPYQLAGFQWMRFLKETGWGGILADDMGLGKTLQALSILQHYLNEHPTALFLVACPTTLIYNWENEIKKYTPDIRFLTHHGPQRRKDLSGLKDINLIITSYGTLRSDIKMLATLPLDYTVLDESQTIKNPLSQVARASLQLQSKNRLALSGTPVQNNTFDLFAQMNFLNPGMLGTMEFFRNEFATPIDKMMEKEAKENLRKLIRPFLLRRTKEQVAPDLPEKTEMILYCEMGVHQRRIYEAYKNTFRSKIMGEIEEKGLPSVQLSVLTGLMKLRQICDSPAILKEDEKFDNYSIKIQELVRSLTENTGNHKSLIFSQFLGMLALIRADLDRLNIPYVYFDGGTGAAEREKAIQKFQNDESCRVFLISLKAGGVGLNLTAADYVYIVDPWWNPAVEQQAIDRTHRIGQTKNIFAYRLICKDTIEEKILLLQERKLTLVKDLISEENAFLKQLTKEDIAYLLS